MIKILKFKELAAEPKLRSTMFRDRATQFVERLGWDITLTCDGLEIDAYDDDDALYLISEDKFGHHAASMRLRPMTGRTLLEDVFPEMMPDCARSTIYWESTRFCLAPQASTQAAREVLLAGQALGLSQGLEGAWGIYDLKMERVYHRLGWAPEKMSEMDDPSGRIALGCWRFSNSLLAAMHVKANLGHRCSRFWVERAKGSDPIFTL